MIQQKKICAASGIVGAIYGVLSVITLPISYMYPLFKSPITHTMESILNTMFFQFGYTPGLLFTIFYFGLAVFIHAAICYGFIYLLLKLR
ncbi:hypothetical protein KKF55_05180 [Patescibacteria group bacterium]|nr:hypothetical protein [Patescibacteria group bacterium]